MKKILFLLLGVVFIIGLESCKENEKDSNVEKETAYTVTFTGSSIKAFSNNKVIIENVTSNQLEAYFNSEVSTAFRFSADTFMVFVPSEGETLFEIPEIEYSETISVTTVSLGSQSADQVIESVVSSIQVEDLGLDVTEEEELSEAIQEAQQTFYNYTEEEKEVVAKYFKANEEEINSLISLGADPGARMSSISEEYCPNEKGLDKLYCLIRPFALNVGIVGTSGVVAVTVSTTGVGALIGGVIGGFVTVPAFLRVKKIGKQMLNTTVILVKDVANGDYEMTNGRVAAIEEYVINGSGEVTLDFEYQLRTLQSGDVSLDDSLITVAINTVTEFESLWNEYIGSDLDFGLSFSESSTTVTAGSSINAEIIDNSGVSVKSLEADGENVHVTLESIPTDGSVTSVQLTLSDSLVARTYTVTIPDFDCNGEAGGTAYLDECNECVGGSTGLGPCYIDCAGVRDGEAYTDACNNCVGGTTGLEPCPVDCNGTPNGDAYEDDCGFCVGGTTGDDPCDISAMVVDKSPFVFTGDNIVVSCPWGDRTRYPSLIYYLNEDGTVSRSVNNGEEILANSYTLSGNSLSLDYHYRESEYYVGDGSVWEETKVSFSGTLEYFAASGRFLATGRLTYTTYVTVKDTNEVKDRCSGTQSDAEFQSDL